MSFMSKPSVKHVRAVRIATQLLTEHKISYEVGDFNKRIGSDYADLPSEFRNALSEEVLDKVSKLALDQSVKVLVEENIVRLAFEITNSYDSRTILRHSRISFQDYLSRIRVTPHGMIDKKRTVESFLCFHQISPLRRFELACENVCKKFIRGLWSQLHVEEKKIIYRGIRDPIKRYISLVYIGSLNEYEVNILVKNILKKHAGKSLFECLVEYSRERNNEVAFEFYWFKLSERERNGNAIEWAKCELGKPIFLRSGILIFLFSQMNSEQRMELLTEFPLEIVAYFLDGGLKQKFVLPKVKTVWNFLSDEHYLKFLKTICERLNRTRGQKMFAEFWIHVPSDLKRKFLENEREFSKLLTNGKDLECLKLVSANMTRDERKQIARSKKLTFIFIDLIRRNKLGYLIDFLGYMSLSDYEIVQLMREFVSEKDARLCYHLINNKQWHSLDNLLNFIFNFEEEINEFKSKLFSTNGRIFCTKFVRQNKLKLIDSFLVWVFPVKERVKKLKREICWKDEGENGKSIIITLLEEGKLKFAEEFVQSCFLTEEVAQFKKELMFSKEMIVSFVDIINGNRLYSYGVDGVWSNDKWNFIERIVNWFGVPYDEAEGFPINFKRFVEEWRVEYGRLFHLICPVDYIEEQTRL